MEQAYLKIENRPRFSFRWGKHNDGGYKAIDALTYSYNGNQVQHISDQAGSLVYDGSFDFKTSDASGQYRFNGNGSMTYDPDKGITIDYSDTGTPQKISFDSGSSTEYVYSADGTKLKVSWNSGQTMCKSFGGFIFFDDFFPPETGSGSGNGSSQSGSSSTTVKSSTEYAGPFVITDGELKQFLFDGGYCTLDNRQAKFHYYVKDHLGSNRIVMSEDGTIEQKTYYYPFGGVYGDVSTNTDVQDYKYNGKELDHMHGLDLYDYGARMYDAAAGIWTSVDPLAEKYYHISPYVYCMNNPVKFIDPDGQEFTESSWEYVNMLINNIDKRLDYNAKKIAVIQEKIVSGGLSEKKVKRLQNRMKRIEANSAELRGVQEEINVLQQSSQVYDVACDDSRNNSNVLGTEVNSVAYFNHKNGVFEIRLGDSSLGLMAHELKHAYQFEIGAYSTGFIKNGSPFYDQNDEWEAYKRGELFGGPQLSVLPPIYSDYQVGPVDYKSLNPMIMGDLQNYARRTQSAFRINGVTYNGIPRK